MTPGPVRYLDVHLGVGVHEVEEALVVGELLVPLLSHVVAEVVAQGNQAHFAAEQLGLLAVLVQKQVGSVWVGQEGEGEGEREGEEEEAEVTRRLCFHLRALHFTFREFSRGFFIQSNKKK